MTQEATSAPDSGQLPSEITAAIDELEREVEQYERGPTYLHPSKDRAEARAALVAAVLKWGEEQKRAGRAEMKDWLDTMSEPEGRGNGPNV